jgi:phosphosulfolactate synthase (CoM biosynthesis protein A)
MKKLCMIASFALFLTACQESLEDRCAREAKEFTRKNCPSKIEKNINIDSLIFERETHTLHYYYTLTGNADREGVMEEINGLDILKENLKNSTAMKVYKENHYNFTYTYHSEKDPKKVLLEVTLTDKDY